jgi:hypothetical protein
MARSGPIVLCRTPILERPADGRPTTGRRIGSLGSCTPTVVLGARSRRRSRRFVRRRRRVRSGQMRRSVLGPTARRPAVLAQMICARVLAHSAYSQSARDQADLARLVSVSERHVSGAVLVTRSCRRLGVPHAIAAARPGRIGG